eukprot:TRINITY_DN30624_c0_g1_i1.p1 TRINITY_DN30624_c0_g1~~TRINITY_DN30624_c0_g1_i1.p1  ORF type:complete len:262 (+),score=54.84 TRINITY_DN30624_c0_g1_i1:60-788(+)
MCVSMADDFDSDIIHDAFSTPRGIEPCVLGTPMARSLESVESYGWLSETFKSAVSRGAGFEPERRNPFWKGEGEVPMGEMVVLDEEVLQGLKRRFCVEGGRAELIRRCHDGSPVYKLRHQMDRMFYAVKVTPIASLNPHEIPATSTLSTAPHIVEYYNSWASNSYAFIQLESAFPVQTLPDPVAAYAAVRALHKAGYCHTQISRESFVSTCLEEVKLADFSMCVEYTPEDALADLLALKDMM